jgi:hypothetical protein
MPERRLGRKKAASSPAVSVAISATKAGLWRCVYTSVAGLDVSAARPT